MRLNCTKIVLYGSCIIIGFAFAWWVTALRVENAEAKRAGIAELIHEQEVEWCEAIAQGEDEWNEILECGWYDTKKYGRVYLEQEVEIVDDVVN